MSLSSFKRNDEIIPKDAKILTREEALQYQLALVRKWEPWTEVFFTKWGAGMLAGVAVVSSVSFLRHFRRKLKLDAQYGMLTSYLPGVVLPALASGFLHTSFIQTKVLLSEYECPLCLQTRGVFIQMSTGFLYPLMLSPLAAFIYATRHFTVRLPYITEEPKAWFNLWWKLNKTAKSLAGVLFTANLVAALAITTMEFKEIANITDKLNEFEQQMEREGKIPEKSVK